MKKYSVLLIFLFSVVLLLGACDGITIKKNYPYEIVSISVRESSKNWVFVNNAESQTLVTNRTGFSFTLDAVFNDVKGREVNSTIIVDEDSNQGQVFINNKPLNKGFVDVTIGAYNAGIVADNVPVKITLKGNANSNVNAGEAETTVNINIIHVLKQGQIQYVREEMKLDYNINDTIDLSGIYVDCTFENNTTVRIPFTEILTSGKYGNAKLDDFETQRMGLNKAAIVTYPTSHSKTSTQMMLYNVMPNPNDWRRQTHANIDFFITNSMTAASLAQKGISFVSVTMGTGFRILLTHDTGYDSTVLTTNIAQFESEMRKENNKGINALIPLGHDIAVTGVITNNHKYFKIHYDLFDSSKNRVSSNTLYLFHSGIINSRIIPVVIEKSDMLTSAQIETANDFISLVWFK